MRSDGTIYGDILKIAKESERNNVAMSDIGDRLKKSTILLKGSVSTII